MSTDIFLSYAREDASKAMELARMLEADGWTVWWDREISPGQDFEVEIDMALAAARAVVVLWSVYSVSSTWVRNEAREAKETNKLIPVQLDDARTPLSYRSLTTIDLRNWPDQQSVVEVSMLKSALNRVLLSGVSNQMLKKPAATDEMSLSVRVASRVAEMVSGQQGARADDTLLQIERCISDILLDLLVNPPATLAAKYQAYLMQLADALGATQVVRTRVDFSRMSVIAVDRLDGDALSPALEKVHLGYVNEYCAAQGEHNLRLDSGAWAEGTLLCLPLAFEGDGRSFAWFSTDAPNPAWNRQLLDSVLKLSTGLLARSDEDA